MLDIVFNKNNRFLVLLLAAILVWVGFLSFQKNYFGFADQNFFDRFDYWSESQVIGGMIGDKENRNHQAPFMGFVRKDAPFTLNNHVQLEVIGELEPHIFDSYDVFGHEKNYPNFGYVVYPSSVGIQAWFFAKYRSWFNIDNIYNLRIVASLIFALTVAILSLLYWRIYDFRFAAIFYLVMVATPWTVAMGKSLFWLPFLFLLPSILSALLYLTTSRKLRLTLYGLIGFSFFLKCLTGYEYLSTIIILASSVFLIAPYFDSANPNPRPDWASAFWVGVVCVLAFLVALLVHVSTLYDHLFSGLWSFYEETIKRRTYGDPNQLQLSYHMKASLAATPWTVVKTYVFNWKTPLLMDIPGVVFKYLVIVPPVLLLLRLVFERTKLLRDGLLFFIMLSVPLSWFILGKAQSFIHVHINFVLWYIGFVPAAIFVLLNSIAILWKRFESK